MKSPNLLQRLALNEDLADSLGIPHRKGEFVQAIEPGKPAAVAGIPPGDVVLTESLTWANTL